MSGESPVVDVELDGDADQHHQGPLRGDSDRTQSVGDGRPRARRRHRPPRRRRHRGDAAVQPRGVRVGRQPEVVLDRRPEDQLGRRQRRRDDAVLRLRDVRGIQHADGVGHRGERCQRRLHEHGDQVGRQPLQQRPQLLLHERRPAGRPTSTTTCAPRLGLPPGQQTGAAGNPIDISYDWSSTLGGPIKRDKAWFFGALRWWRLDQFQIGALNPDGSQAIDDNRIDNFMGKVDVRRWRRTRRASFMFNRNLKDRFHRRDAPYLSSRTRRRCCRISRRRTTSRRSNQVLGRETVLDARFGRMWGVFPTPLSDGGAADRHRDSRHRAQHAHQCRGDAVAQSESPLPGERDD